MPDFIKFITTHCVTSYKSAKPTDFNAIAFDLKKISCSRLKIVIDADTCLDRLYGGVSSNWVAGSDYSRMGSFLNHLVVECNRNHIELIFYFNGTNPKDSNETNCWLHKEKIKHQNVATVINSLENNPDQRIENRDWIKPVNLIRQIVNQLRSDKINQVNKVIHTFNSVRNHQKEIIEFCQLNKFEFLLSSDPEIMMLLCSQKLENSIRLFSAKSLKLLWRGMKLSVCFF